MTESNKPICVSLHVDGPDMTYRKKFIVPQLDDRTEEGFSVGQWLANQSRILETLLSSDTDEEVRVVPRHVSTAVPDNCRDEPDSDDDLAVSALTDELFDFNPAPLGDDLDDVDPFTENSELDDAQPAPVIELPAKALPERLATQELVSQAAVKGNSEVKAAAESTLDTEDKVASASKEPTPASPTAELTQDAISGFDDQATEKLAAGIPSASVDSVISHSISHQDDSIQTTDTVDKSVTATEPDVKSDDAATTSTTTSDQLEDDTTQEAVVEDSEIANDFLDETNLDELDTQSQSDDLPVADDDFDDDDVDELDDDYPDGMDFDQDTETADPFGGLGDNDDRI